MKKRTTTPKSPKNAPEANLPTWNKSRMKEADAIISKRVIARDKHCQFLGCNKTTGLTCSHYIPRANKATRFYEDNCIALCSTHHFFDKQLGYEFQKQRLEVHGWDGRYTLHMKQWLGELRWDMLLARAKMRLKPKEIKRLVYETLGFTL